VVGDRDVLVPFPPRGPDQRVEVVGAVRPFRVDVEIPPDVLDGQQIRKDAALRRLDLPRVLAQFGRDEGEAQRLVDLSLEFPPDPFPVALPEHAVLVDL